MIKCIVKVYGSHATGTYTTQGEYYGLSTDDKNACEEQTGRAPENADLFYEMDRTDDGSGNMRREVSMFDGDSKTWLPQ